MKNAAGDKGCDEYIAQELREAGIPFESWDFLKKQSEVPSAIIGILDGWTFRRAWYYWIAKSEDTVLLFEYAEPLHEQFGDEVRVSGHCGCPSPREWYDKPWHIGVNLYHIDSQSGLNALANAIRNQSNRDGK